MFDYHPMSEASDDSIHQALTHYYEGIESKIFMREPYTKTTYRSPVNFIESMQRPRHRWFPYKEGFSPSFVADFLTKSQSASSGIILDPFVGSGTTALVAGELGLKGIGLDVSPLTTFVAKTKSSVLNRDELSLLNSVITDYELSTLSKYAPYPSNKTILRYFEPEVFGELHRTKHYCSELKTDKFRDLFKLAFLNAIEPFSTHRKAGNGVKIKTNYVSPIKEGDCSLSLKNFVTAKLREFALDIRQTEVFLPPEFHMASSLSDELDKNVENISCVLTSPPYANCFDYSKIYMSELWLGDFFKSRFDQQRFRSASVRSHVHASWADRFEEFGSPIVNEKIRPLIERQMLWSPRIGGMLSGYFADLGRLLANLKPRLRRNAQLGFVVGNSFYGGIAVATDLLLADLGMRLGYVTDEVRVYRGIIPSSQQYKRLGRNRKYMRESLVVMRNA